MILRPMWSFIWPGKILSMYCLGPPAENPIWLVFYKLKIVSKAAWSHDFLPLRFLKTMHGKPMQGQVSPKERWARCPTDTWGALVIDSCWGEEHQCSVSVWPLVGWPCSSGWPHTQEYLGGTNWTQLVFKGENEQWVTVKLGGEENRGRSRRSCGRGWIWSEYF